MRPWKRLIVVSASGGAGFAVMACIIWGAVRWYQSRPRPWNTRAIKASFVSIGTEGKDRALVFNYTLENMTPSDFRVADKQDIEIDGRKGNALRETPAESNYLTINLPLFIPARQRQWVEIHFGYSPQYRDACIDEISHPTAGLTEGRTSHQSPPKLYTIQSFASAVKRKFAACQSVGDKSLVALVGQMYPVYWGWLRPGEQEKMTYAVYPDEKALVAFAEKRLPSLDGFVFFDNVHHYEIDFPKGW